jgi:hypothetical protein
MSLPSQWTQELAAFPAALRALIEAELAAGNEIVEISSSFPAPPAGAYAKLARPVSACPRASSKEIDFYDRNGPSYSGEFTDAKRFYFVLEPPRPPPPEPDMNAIRAEIQARQSGGAAESAPASRGGPAPSIQAAPALITEPNQAPEAPFSAAVERFRQGMVIDYEKWHDGIGYNLSILESASPGELVEIEAFLVHRPISDWRDVEALATLNTPQARLRLHRAFKSGNSEIVAAVRNYAPDLVSSDERITTLVTAIKGSTSYHGLTPALLEIEDFHPPEIVEALLQGALQREGETAVHFAAMLMFIHGKAESSFDWALRPFFLRFHTEDREGRASVFRELCEKIGATPETYLAAPAGE